MAVCNPTRGSERKFVSDSTSPSKMPDLEQGLMEMHINYVIQGEDDSLLGKACQIRDGKTPTAQQSVPYIKGERVLTFYETIESLLGSDVEFSPKKENVDSGEAYKSVYVEYRNGKRIEIERKTMYTYKVFMAVLPDEVRGVKTAVENLLRPYNERDRLVELKQAK